MHGYLIVIIVILLVIFTSWMIWSNLVIEQTNFIITNEFLPNAFDGFKIAHISDLHNAEFGKNNVRLINKLRDANPDIIAITGDSIDSRHSDMEVTLNFIEQAMEIAQCYFVVGNHESRFSKSEYEPFEEKLKMLGVIVLHNEAAIIEQNGEKIAIWGVDDPNFNDDFLENLNKGAKGDEFTILLSHRPEYFEEYVKYGYNLVLSGHAHGGQFRIPFVGGVFAPKQGLFPKYDSGVHSENKTTMIVSRGLGNSSFPIRFNNNPELIVIELFKEVK